MFNNYTAAPMPWWNNLGSGTQVIGPTNAWSSQHGIYQRNFRYYTGQNFQDVIPNSEAVNDEPQHLAQPVGLNLSKMLCVAMADALLGEWEDRAIDFSFEPVRGKEISEEDRAKLRQFANDMFSENDMDQRYWEAALDQNRYGGSVFKIAFEVKHDSGIRLERIDPTAFYPIWDPDDLNHLLECFIAVLIPASVAEIMYKIPAPSGTQPGGWVTRIEHWTPEKYETRIGTTIIPSLYGKNPYSFVPFVYTPRLRSTGYYGESLIEDTYRASDELNFRVADLGESLNYNTHPVKWGTDLPANFNQQNYPLDPGTVWNLGRTIGQEKAELNLLESKHALPPEAFQYVKFLYDWARTASNAPPVAFGEDQGSQRSGATLILRMYPLIRAVKRSRAYNGTGLRQLLRMAFDIVKDKKPLTVDPSLIALFDSVKAEVLWAPIIPRDRVQVVDEIVKRLSTNPPTISQRRAIELMRDANDVDDEMERITKMQEESAKFAQASAPPPFGGGSAKGKEKDELSSGANNSANQDRVAH